MPSHLSSSEFLIEAWTNEARRLQCKGCVAQKAKLPLLKEKKKPDEPDFKFFETAGFSARLRASSKVYGKKKRKVNQPKVFRHYASRILFLGIGTRIRFFYRSMRSAELSRPLFAATMSGRIL